MTGISQVQEIERGQETLPKSQAPHRLLLKIVFFISANYYGGINRVYSELACALTKRGHRVKVVMPVVPQWAYHRWTTRRRLSPIRWQWFSLIYVLRAILREALRLRFRWVVGGISGVQLQRCFLKPSLSRVPDADVYVLCNNWYQVEELPGIDAVSDRVVQFIQHYDDYEDPLLKQQVQKAYQRPFRRLASCRATATELRNRGISIDREIFLGINPAWFHPSSVDRDRWSVLMYWGLETRKGAQVGFAAMEQLRRRFPQLTIRLFCPNERYPLPSGYERVTAVDDRSLGEALRAHAIFVFPSLMEGFGLPPLEAMACGCAVVSTVVGAVEEFAEHGQSAYLVRPGQPQAIAEAVAHLLDDDALRRRIARGGELAASTHTWEKSADALEEFFSTAIPVSAKGANRP